MRKSHFICLKPVCLRYLHGLYDKKYLFRCVISPFKVLALSSDPHSICQNDIWSDLIHSFCICSVLIYCLSCGHAVSAKLIQKLLKLLSLLKYKKNNNNKLTISMHNFPYKWAQIILFRHRCFV